MLFESDRHEALKGVQWNEAVARSAIRHSSGMRNRGAWTIDSKRCFNIQSTGR